MSMVMLAGCTSEKPAEPTSSSTAENTPQIKATYDTNPEIAPSEDTIQENEENAYTLQEETYDFAQYLDDVPESYYYEADQEGTLEYFDYDTYNYDGDGHSERKYAVVYLPYGYTSTQQYDIMYLMHGAGGYAEIFLGDPDEPTSMKYMIDHLIEEGKMNPTIIVCCSYYDYNEEEINDDEDAELTKNFGTELTNDLMPAVESHYSTYAPTADEAGFTASRDHRIFGGFSMGGVTTWYRFMDCMSYFRWYMPMSGMLYWGPDCSKDGRDPQEWAGQMLVQSLNDQGYTKDDFYIYMCTGGFDEAKPLLEYQISSMNLYPSVFTFGSASNTSANCTYAYSTYAEHSWLAVFQYMYYGLPIFSSKINALS